MPLEKSRPDYARRYGPTTGDQIRLADTGLFAQIEADLTAKVDDQTKLPAYGEEMVFGPGRTIREDMGQGLTNRGAVDTVITNVVVIDHTGVIKADVGLRNGGIFAIGKAGNAQMKDVTILIGPETDVIAGEGKILTPGGVDVLAHFINPQQLEAALASGITTLLGGGVGPTTASKAAAITPGAWNLGRMLQAADAFPLNLGFAGKGNTANPDALIKQIRAGAVYLSLDEAWGVTPAAVECCLNVCEREGLKAVMGTDTLNESGFIENTINLFQGRPIHICHVEGAPGGHAPDNIKLCGERNVVPSSTTATRPYAGNAMAELPDMIATAENLDPSMADDMAYLDSRVRKETIGAEDILHDMGAISIIGSGGLCMGLAGQVVLRTWQTADKMKRQRGALPGNDPADNGRIKRYIAKYTINPAIAHGLSSHVGSVTPGKRADLVLWDPAFFGVKPAMVIVGGMIVCASLGDAHAATTTAQPLSYQSMFGAFGGAVNGAVTFVTQAAIDHGQKDTLNLRKTLVAVDNCWGIDKSSMILNSATPHIDVDPETYTVRADGESLVCDPITINVPMTQRYFLY